VIFRHLRISEDGRTLHAGSTLELSLGQFDSAFIVGAGKAAAPMAATVEEVLRGRLTWTHTTLFSSFWRLTGKTEHCSQLIILRRVAYEPDDRVIA
jgi:hypothetical protein